jgi:hypothetical protein
MPSVVDTNVLIVANRRAEQADLSCEETCIHRLKEIEERGVLLIDDRLLILIEYMHHANFSGQPGAGDKFFKWAWSVQADERFCQRVSITPSDTEQQNFVEFPQDSRLSTFDHSDRKFVAVALKSSANAEIFSAVDSDWEDHADVLNEIGVHLCLICSRYIEDGDRRWR